MDDHEDGVLDVLPDDVEIGLGEEFDVDAITTDGAEDHIDVEEFASPEEDPELDQPAADDAASTVKVTIVNRAMVEPGQSDEAVKSCDVTIGDRSGTTNGYGNVTIDLSGLADGDYPLRVLSPDSTTDPAGPGTPSNTGKSRVWRPFDGSVTINDGLVTHATPTVFVDVSNGRLRIALQPIWIRTSYSRSRTNDPDMIVIHHTAGTKVRSDVRHLVFSGAASVHYLVTPNGEVYKFADDKRTTWHAGASYWQGVKGMNSKSIGIEMTHRDDAYAKEQVDAVVDLVKRIHDAYPSIPPGRVIAHSDIAITRRENRPPTRHGRKSTDPGSMFPWERIEALGLGLQIAEGKVDPVIYSGFFETYPNGRIRLNDRDDQRRYDGAVRSGMSGIVLAIQKDFARIGYLTAPHDGQYGRITAYAVQMFQQHMFSGSRRTTSGEHSGDGRVDRVTADMIKRVLGDVDHNPPS